MACICRFTIHSGGDFDTFQCALSTKKVKVARQPLFRRAIDARQTCLPARVGLDVRLLAPNAGKPPIYPISTRYAFGFAAARNGHAQPPHARARRDTYVLHAIGRGGWYTRRAFAARLLDGAISLLICSASGWDYYFETRTYNPLGAPQAVIWDYDRPRCARGFQRGMAKVRRHEWHWHAYFDARLLMHTPQDTTFTLRDRYALPEAISLPRRAPAGYREIGKRGGAARLIANIEISMPAQHINTHDANAHGRR